LEGKDIFTTSLSFKVWLEVAQLLWCHCLRISQDCLIGASPFAWKVLPFAFLPDFEYDYIMILYMILMPVFVIVDPSKTRFNFFASMFVFLCHCSPSLQLLVAPPGLATADGVGERARRHIRGWL